MCCDEGVTAAPLAPCSPCASRAPGCISASALSGCRDAPSVCAGSTMFAGVSAADVSPDTSDAPDGSLLPTGAPAVKACVISSGFDVGGGAERTGMAGDCGGMLKVVGEGGWDSGSVGDEASSGGDSGSSGGDGASGGGDGGGIAQSGQDWHSHLEQCFSTEHQLAQYWNDLCDASSSHGCEKA